MINLGEMAALVGSESRAGSGEAVKVNCNSLYPQSLIPCKENVLTEMMTAVDMVTVEAVVATASVQAES